MKRLLLIAVVAVVGMTGVAHAADGVAGVDVSNWTGEVDWEAVTSGSGKFAFVHATEGVDYRSPSFEAQFGGAAAAGLVRGAYHFAQPHESGGAQQADHFVQNGGAWTADGQTLPGVLDVEDNPYKDRNGKNGCYGLSAKDMVRWIGDFTKRYQQRTGRRAIIYTTTSWWRTCTGDSAKFAANPLWLARWGADPGELPKGWQKHTFWQSAEKGTLPGGQNAFNGTEAELKSLTNPPAEVTVSGKARSRTGYTLTVANTGPHRVTDIKVSGRAFGGQRVVRASSGCKFSGTAVRCGIAELNRGQKATFVFTTKPKGKGKVGIRFQVGTVDLELRAR
ncbi:GH25 family lysozyme [Nonomuraea sp. LPB2021202275-12-8]|uniref:GH25 family lysozyme n=1 Tax=Nonomuraea sp. LPB2021202275-12-8 TaxID=3120159 RepID=UPI00300D49A1